MLVERLKVSDSFMRSARANIERVGTQHRSIQTRSRDPSHVNPNLNILNDFRSQASEILTTTLSRSSNALHFLASIGRQGEAKLPEKYRGLTDYCDRACLQISCLFLP